MEKLLLTVWDAADVLSVSRSRVYELLYAEQRVWTGAGYCDPDTGVMLPTWRQALDHLDADPDAGPVHVIAVRNPSQHRRHHRPLRRRGPGRALPREIPDQGDRRSSR
jgi:hypothetical protein